MVCCLRICLWSGPRNVSTALMYAFARRTDTRVLDEPLYGHYLRVSGAEHPGAGEVMTAMECDGDRVAREVILGPCDRPVLFMKQMAHHLVEINRGFLLHTTSVLLIRDPADMLPSLARQLQTPALRDTGLKMQDELLQELLSSDQNAPVLDARELLLNPADVLRQLCERIHIPFEPAMLCWPAGTRSEDGVWAKHWYHNVHRSTGFQPYTPKSTPFPDRLRPLLEECRPHYERLYKHAIKANEPR